MACRWGWAGDGANRHDMTLVRATLERIVVSRPRATEDALQRMCLDKGYDYDEVRAIVTEVGFTAHLRSHSEGTREWVQEAGKRARRWVVEHMHS